MAFTLFSDGAYAKTGERVWGNSNGKRFILAIPPRKSGAHAKTGDFRPAWGNSWRNRFIMATAKPFGLAKRFGLAKQGGMTLVVAAIDHNWPQILGSPCQGIEEVKNF